MSARSRFVSAAIRRRPHYGSMSDRSGNDPTFTAPAPIRPPPAAARPPSRSSSAQLPPNVMAQPGYRARALAKVSRAAQSTSEFVAPRFDSARQSAVGRLNELRERHDSDTDLRAAATRSGRQNSLPYKNQDYVDPVAAAQRRGTASSSASTSTASSSDGKSRWAGWTGYFSSNYRKDRDPSTYGEEMIVAFPGVSRQVSAQARGR